MIAQKQQSKASLSFLDKIFKYTERGSNAKTEVIGGVTTFLTMAYIVFVNPAILSDAGMDKSALITVTILATAIGTLIFAFLANAPFALAPGMGLNAFFTYSLVIGEGTHWTQALGVVFISGTIFLILAVTGVRKYIADAIPKELSIASAAGIGLFLSFVGLKGMGVIVGNPDTLVALADFTPTVLIALFGLVLMGIFEVKKVKGGILISIIVTTVLSIVLGYVELPTSIISAPPSIAPVAFKLDILGALKFSLIGPIFSFMFIDMFDSLAFLISCCKQMGLEDKDGNIKGLSRMLYADVTSTLIGSMLGTSTVTTFGESAAGIAAGARTGLASVVTASLFLVTLLFTPLLGVVPSYAASPALVMVGVFMFSSIRQVDFNDSKIAVSAFVTVLLMPLTYSISIGLCFGFISYIIMHVVSKETEKISVTLWIIGALSVLNLMLS
ncbi:NCS2 family permease [Romboutsia sp. 1001216sp1]|uniref:NCS2 family permease n=1 Tax=Romboutsia sp. 1001216sp1 TaxID=2986997 RepID=UPI00232EF4CC|nr:NCS2 family permease [Romboutsia sp. 1001216sp1]MDB8803582.1 NCS2 family permease [Romboutsia sp. 1001216sp1]MDB8807916.1 NCS2 family permease [Romboutsia sp. 1001216sp1]MDB8809230.1 NCS2 family permease [Romboutsia sp. 1001216sp1]MDB8814978.1 NCS2 family permease [Romboutsia sp. 1001216sp1]MDB8819711.1 NCS2 family permease [Romboutsia sp. 1001216sp1]